MEILIYLRISSKNCTRLGAQPNQSLKLTETAVDDLTRAKQSVTIGQDLARADGFRRCGASPPQLSSGR